MDGPQSPMKWAVTMQAYSSAAPVFIGPFAAILVLCTDPNNIGVTFRGLIFDTCSGGCIVVHPGNTCSVVIDNCVFRNSLVSSLLSPVHVDASAAAVQITDSTFMDNVVQDFSGGITLANMVQPATITRCLFLRNKAQHNQVPDAGGGGLFYTSGPAVVPAATLVMDSCVFQENICDAGGQSTYRGGAMYLDTVGGGVNMSSTIFRNNTCDSDGGALVVLNAPSLSVRSSLFESNHASDTTLVVTGGAVALVCAIGGCVIDFRDCTWRSNSVLASQARGGAVGYGTGGTFTPSFASCFFFDNTVVGVATSGGAIGVGGAAALPLDLSSTVFCRNNASSSSAGLDVTVPGGVILTAPRVGTL
jgi:hypothetical protein